MKLKIIIRLKQEILDPQGQAIGNALKALGFNGIGPVRQGKIISVDLNETDQETAIIQGQKMCEKLLVNDVIEEFSISVE